MQLPNWKIICWMILRTYTLLSCFGMVVPVFGQCFTDNDDMSDGMAKTSVAGLPNASLTFALSSFKSVVKFPSTVPASGNFHISPLSIRAALIVTYLGARANTKTEMGTALGTGDLKQKKVLEIYRQLKNAIVHQATKTSNYTISIADRLYFDKSAKLRKCIVGYLNSELEQVDFRSASEPSRQLINKWVEDRTNKRIVDLIPPANIDSSTLMVIVNAIYFKAAWAKTFEPQATKDEDFFIEPGKSKKVRMMHQMTNIPYGSSSQLDCTAVELPYSGKEISMVILLPNSNVRDLLSKLSTESLNDLLGRLNPTIVELALPKLKVTQSFELKENLKSLGMKDLFDGHKADLSGFTGDKNSFVSFVRHKTFIEVNEGGTEAAAATAVGMGRALAVAMPESIFKVDRPFLFLIRHKKSENILFIGLINDPTAQD